MTIEMHLHNTAYIAVAAIEINIELTTTAVSLLTRIKMNVETPVASVQMASDFRLPRRVWIIHAPSCHVSDIHVENKANIRGNQDSQRLQRKHRSCRRKSKSMVTSTVLLTRIQHKILQRSSNRLVPLPLRSALQYSRKPDIEHGVRYRRQQSDYARR